MQDESFGKVLLFPLIQLSKSFRFHSISHNRSHNNQTNNHNHLFNITFQNLEFWDVTSGGCTLGAEVKAFLSVSKASTHSSSKTNGTSICKIFPILKLYATQWFSREEIKWLLQVIWNMSWEFQRIRFKVFLELFFNLELFGFYSNYFSPKIKYMEIRVKWFPTTEIGEK